MFLNRKVYKYKQHTSFMPIKNYKNDLMFKLDPKFIGKIFSKLTLKFGNSEKASKFLKVPYSSFRGYKNGYFSSLPEHLIKKILSTKIISKKEINKNTILTYYRDDYNKKILKNGRDIRHKKLKKWKQEIPNLNAILKNSSLDFEKWFLSYQKLINFGARKFNYIKKKKNFIEVSYITYSNKTKKEFVLKFPIKIMLNNDFLYFFGLWIGDKTGGGRLGIMNKEEEILSFVKKYLKKLTNQNPITVLYIAKTEKLPRDRRFNYVVRIKHKRKGYAFSVHVTNGILVSFFKYLEENLNEFLNTIENPNIFFAGLFDAEGNVFLEDSCFRWSCKNDSLTEIFRMHLKKLDLFKRYDGSNFVTYNKNKFRDQILPYMLHVKKVNNANLVCFGKGKLEKRFKNILNIIKQNQGVTNNELAKALKKKKVYAQVRVLEKLGYVHSKNYPKQIFINKKILY